MRKSGMRKRGVRKMEWSIIPNIRSFFIIPVNSGHTIIIKKFYLIKF